MRIDFNKIEAITIPGMNKGTGTMTAHMFAGEHERIIVTRIHPDSSIGMHIQESGDDINFVLSGTGIAICDGKEEPLSAGICHICPQGSSHSIKNTGPDDLVMITVVA